MSEKNIKNTVITTLSEFLGVTTEDVTLDDALRDDLHMSPSDISDYMERMHNSNLNVQDLKMEDIETVGELIDELILISDL